MRHEHEIAKYDRLRPDRPSRMAGYCRSWGRRMGDGKGSYRLPAGCLLVRFSRRRELWRKALVMLQTSHAILIAFVSQLTYKGNWTMARPVGRFEYSPSRGATLRSPMHSARRVIAPRSIPLPRLTALATQNLSARAVTLVRCQLHELPDRAFLIRFAPSLL